MAIAVVSLWVGAAVLSPAQAQDKAGKAGLGGPAGTVLESGLIHNIVEWDGGTLPAVYERSDQLPMTLDDVRKLSESKFSEASITNMLEQRRCACDASVDALVSLKEAGVAEAVIEAVSLHALRPNRFIDLTISLDFEGKGGMAEISTQARRCQSRTVTQANPWLPASTDPVLCHIPTANRVPLVILANSQRYGWQNC